MCGGPQHRRRPDSGQLKLQARAGFPPLPQPYPGHDNWAGNTISVSGPTILTELVKKKTYIRYATNEYRTEYSEKKVNTLYSWPVHPLPCVPGIPRSLYELWSSSYVCSLLSAMFSFTSKCLYKSLMSAGEYTVFLASTPTSLCSWYPTQFVRTMVIFLRVFITVSDVLLYYTPTPCVPGIPRSLYELWSSSYVCSLLSAMFSFTSKCLYKSLMSAGEYTVLLAGTPTSLCAWYPTQFVRTMVIFLRLFITVSDVLLTSEYTVLLAGTPTSLCAWYPTQFVRTMVIFLLLFITVSDVLLY
ncbi:hypothetical protein J6590_070002 [Homalodisca vitripennis]|nr:hypothetical protein J6590_070002 [Homalodisca vitripennis]